MKIAKARTSRVLSRCVPLKEFFNTLTLLSGPPTPPEIMFLSASPKLSAITLWEGWIGERRRTVD
jgi:hypothetical protein